MRKALAGIVFVIALALQAHAAGPVDGKWEARLPDSRGGQTTVVFELSAKGNDVVGTISSWNGQQQLHKVFVQDGKLQGNTVTFGTFFALPFLYNRYGLREMVYLVRGLGSPTNRVAGTVAGNSISFTQHDWKGDTLEFQALRVK